VNQRGCGNHAVCDLERSALSFGLCSQGSPASRHRFIDRENPDSKLRAQRCFQPSFQFISLPA
jgi:hypothetical protein